MSLVRSGAGQAGLTIYHPLKCLRCDLRGCWSNSCNLVCLNASFQPISHVFFSLSAPSLLLLPVALGFSPNLPQEGWFSCRLQCQVDKYIADQISRSPSPSLSQPSLSRAASVFHFSRSLLNDCRFHRPLSDVCGDEAIKAEMTWGSDRQTPL